MLAKNIMTRDVITVSPSMTVRQVAMLLTKNNISGVPVRDKNGKVVGIVSHSDIVGKRGKKVKEIMTKKIISVAKQTRVEEIVGMMTAKKIDRVLVMEGDQLLGIVSQADIVGSIAMGRYVAGHAPGYDSRA
jgi:CBS domain-containing protein